MSEHAWGGCGCDAPPVRPNGFVGAVIAIPAAAGYQLVLQEVTFPSLDRR
jgi:hypothetical protein